MKILMTEQIHHCIKPLLLTSKLCDFSFMNKLNIVIVGKLLWYKHKDTVKDNSVVIVQIRCLLDFWHDFCVGSIGLCLTFVFSSSKHINKIDTSLMKMNFDKPSSQCSYTYVTVPLNLHLLRFQSLTGMSLQLLIKGV